MQLHIFSDALLLATDLAQKITKILCEAIALRGEAYLVVSGGSTPITLFQLLAKTQLPWEKVWVTLADERCVPVSHSDSNEHLVREHLLQHEARKARFISLYEDHVLDLEPYLNQLEWRFSALPLFDVVILGMGEDGHTASLFPYCKELDEQASKALFSLHPKTASHQRITLSQQRLLASRCIFVHILGQKKREVFNKALVEPDPKIMPISAFLNHQTAAVQVVYAP